MPPALKKATIAIAHYQTTSRGGRFNDEERTFTRSRYHGFNIRGIGSRVCSFIRALCFGLWRADVSFYAHFHGSSRRSRSHYRFVRAVRRLCNALLYDVSRPLQRLFPRLFRRFFGRGTLYGSAFFYRTWRWYTRSGSSPCGGPLPVLLGPQKR